MKRENQSEIPTVRHLSEDALAIFRDVGKNNVEAARKHASGRRGVGHLLTDAPLELLHAAGLYPVGILSHAGPARISGKHFQSFTCRYSMGSLDLLLDGSYNFLEGVIVPFVCDTTRCVDLVLRDEKPFPFVECYRPPKSLTGPGAREYLIGEIGRLKLSIEKYTGNKISTDAISASIKTYNKARAQLRRIEPLRLTNPGAYFDICRAYTTLPVEEFIDQAGYVEVPDAQPSSKGQTDILLAGKFAEPLDLPDVLRSMGVRIVADDMAVGKRMYAVDVAESGDPIVAIAERLLNDIPYAGLVQPLEERPDYLVRRARETGAQGVILLVSKFCETFELDAPEVRERLKREKIPAIILETDFDETVSGPTRTRVEAFLEMLRHG